MSVRAWLFGLKGKWNWTNLFLIYNILSILSLSPACSVHGRKLYRFPFLNLALSLLIDLHWSTIYDDLQRNGFAIEARVDNVWSHFSQFGHVLDVYLSKVKVADLYLVQLGMVAFQSVWPSFFLDNFILNA